MLVKMKRINLALIWSVALLVAGCNSEHNQPAANSGSNAAQLTESEVGNAKNLPTTANASKHDTVIIRGMKYIPAVIEVNKGDTVVFVNKDIVAHDVTEENEAWGSSEIPVGQSWSMVATESVSYFCSIHVVMKGKVVVK